MNKLPSTPWLQYWKPRPWARLRLFCFPYAGGHAALFRNWSEQLPSDIELCPIQLPGRERRIGEEPYSRLPELIDTLVRILNPYLDKPYALFGHSMGALISFELARALRRMRTNSPLIRLFVSAHRAPHLPLQRSSLYNLPNAAFVEKLRQFNGTSEEILQNPELLSLLLPLLRADFALCETYCYTSEQPLTSPISVFGGLQDLETTPSMLEAWHEQTSSQCKVHLFAGDHFYIHQAQEVLLSVLAQDLAQDLKELS